VNLTRRLLSAAAIVSALVSAPSRVAAQAGTLPQGVAAVTLAWQYIDNTGHRPSDGTLFEVGQSISTGVLFEIDYGVTDRLSATVGIPYIFAKYTDGAPPPFIPYLPVDTCHCWHSSFQDISLTARYRLGDDPWAVTPLVRYVQPSHNYDYRGEAVVGRDLRELQAGVNASVRLVNLLPRAGLQAGYTYSSVQRILDVRNDRSNVFVSIGYAVTSRLFVHADANWQRTHGGLRFGSPSGVPCVSPCDVNTPELLHEHDRMLRDNFWHAGGGLSYSFGPFDLFASISKYVSGTNTHNGQAYTAGMTWYFNLSKQQ
jgi:hypothetical protein